MSVPGTGLDGWTFPPHGYPTLWIGPEEATQADLDALEAYVSGAGGTSNPDQRTLVGTRSADWWCDYYDDYPPRYPMGGIGSTAYEYQHIDPAGDGGVTMWKEPGFYVNADNAYTHGMPPNGGAVHRGAHGLWYEGPRPDSEAERVLKEGGGVYRWNKTRKWWVVREPK